MHLHEIERPPVGEKTQNGKGLRFMQQKSVVITGQLVRDERHDKIKFRPREHAQDRHRTRPVPAGQHQENHADDDARMRNEKTEKTKIRKAEAEIWCEHGLERPADSPKISDLKPAVAAAPHRHDHDDHSPIAKLERQHLRPAHDAAAIAHKNQIGRII